MRLIIVRHGIAIDRTDPKSPPEADRFLTEKGISRTRQVAQGLKAMGIAPTVFLSSPWLRARQTADIVAEALDFPKKDITDTVNLLWDANPAHLFRELAALNAEEVACFGHAPNVDDLMAFALGGGRHFTEMKKAGAACLEINPPEPGGTLVWYLPPRLLRQLGD